MPDPWTFSEEITRVSEAGGALTLVEGASFCISDARGDIAPGGAHGLFFLDTRFLSRLELRVDGQPLESLGVSVDEPFEATFLCRVRAASGHSDSALVVIRRRCVGYGLREVIEVRNYDTSSRTVDIDVLVGADFADLFAVKEGRVRRRGAYSNDIQPGRLLFGRSVDGSLRGVTVDLEDATDVDGDRATWRVTIEPASTWSTEITVFGTVDGDRVPTRLPASGASHADHGSHHLTQWRHRAPVVDSDNHTLDATVAQSIDDLGALRLFDERHPDLPVIAAGAPWFMTLFGRDSLLTAWMALPVDVDLARGVVETLARLQGSRIDPESDEEPGKILHELRFDKSSSLSLSDASAYYGSIDATPLFVMLLGELRRWGLEDEVVDRLLPHADRALAWIEEFGDRDGDGFVEYQRATEHGLANQGWKDSWDGIRYADGRVAEAPLALCEVQGYVYAAYLARAHFAWEADDSATAHRYRGLAATLKERFNRDFWMPDREHFAVALDRDKNPVDSLTSNIGHCLWTGIVDEDKAGAVARHLLSPEMFSGWGVRTMAASVRGFNPISYHCGSVWPHDNALTVAGLTRYGFVDEAHRITEAMFAVASSMGWRLPELFAGVDRGELGVPAAYPTSCVPQAWAAAAPLLMLRAMLRLDPWLPHGKVWMAPALPPSVRSLRISNIRLGASTATISVVDGTVSVEGLPPGVEWINRARKPLTAEIPT